MLHIFIRHCFYSSASSKKERPQGFDRSKIFAHVLSSLKQHDFRIVLDEKFRPTVDAKHFTELTCSTEQIHYIEAGSEPIAFITQLEYVRKLMKEKQWSSNDIIVFLEDDYAVKEGWIKAIEEGLQFADYVTLYDHPDKYNKTIYPSTPCEMYVSPSAHWRTTPSTTNSFACTLSTLIQDYDEHIKWSAYENMTFTLDHQKFLSLWNQGKRLVSSIPSYWSHEEKDMQPPRW
jgi:hypothetical protein